MANVTIISLIYCSPEYAIGLYKRLIEVTPALKSGEAEFYFVANNANQKTLDAIRFHQIPYMEFNPPVLSDLEHEKLGFAKPEYIGRVYAAYNYGIKKSKTPLVVLINSDMVFSENWLENLIKLDDGESIVSCTLVERRHPKFGVFPGAIEANFGSSFRNLDWGKWKEFSRNYIQMEIPISSGGPYMPALFHKSWFEEYSFYPEGNIRIHEKPYSEVSMYGDEYLFSTFQRFGIRHISASSSLCYHFKEGERGTLVSQRISIASALIMNPVRDWKSKIKRVVC